jgi:splicing factor 3B subunit 3
MTKGEFFRTSTLIADYVIIASDSGRLSIVEFVIEPTPHLESLYQEVYGKTGSR